MPTPCKHCRGTGELQPGVPCIRCRGKGKIFSKREREKIEFITGMLKACHECEQIAKKNEQKLSRKHDE